jgi:WD40 repeat protein
VAAWIYAVTYSPDGKLLVSGGDDRNVSFLSPTTAKRVRTLPIGETVRLLSYSPDGKWLAVGKEDV